MSWALPGKRQFITGSTEADAVLPEGMEPTENN